MAYPSTPWHFSQLRLPSYRSSHLRRYHPYARYSPHLREILRVSVVVSHPLGFSNDFYRIKLVIQVSTISLPMAIHFQTRSSLRKTTFILYTINRSQLYPQLHNWI